MARGRLKGKPPQQEDAPNQCGKRDRNGRLALEVKCQMIDEQPDVGDRRRRVDWAVGCRKGSARVEPVGGQNGPRPVTAKPAAAAIKAPIAWRSAVGRQSCRLITATQAMPATTKMLGSRVATSRPATRPSNSARPD